MAKTGPSGEEGAFAFSGEGRLLRLVPVSGGQAVGCSYDVCGIFYEHTKDVDLENSRDWWKFWEHWK